MEVSTQNVNGSYRCRMREFISRNTGSGPLRRADMMLRINLAPIMGRRDAGFDVAEELICKVPFGALEVSERCQGYWEISRLLRRVCDDTFQILMLLTSPDTRKREQHFMSQTIMLNNLAAALANFYELGDMIFSSDGSLLWETVCAPEERELEKISGGVAAVESDLLMQLRNSFRRFRVPVNRYRGYAAKSFSAENGDRYRHSYSAFTARSEKLLARFSVAFDKNSSTNH